MLTISNVLVPIDFSDVSPRVLEYGRALSEAYGACLHLLHVLPYPVSAPESAAAKRAEVLERLGALPVTAGDRARTVFACEIGTPAHEIVAYAETHAIDLIVMGTHSHGPTFQMVAGSVAECVLGRAPCPVLAVQGAAAAALHPRPAANAV